MWFHKKLFALAVFALSLAWIHPVLTKASPPAKTSETKTPQRSDLGRSLNVDRANNFASYDYPQIFDIVRPLFAQPHFVRLISRIFADLLFINPATNQPYKNLSPKDTELQKTLSEARFIKLLRRNPEIWDDLRDFLKEFPRETPAIAKISQEIAARQDSLHTKAMAHADKDAIKKVKDDIARLKKRRATRIRAKAQVETQEFAKRFQKALRRIVASPKARQAFIRDNAQASKPIALFLSPEDLAAGRTGYKFLDFQATHEMLENGRVIPPGDLEKMMVDFVDQTQKELVLNFYEFDSEKIAEALLRARQRGVNIRIGFDKNVMHHFPQRMAIYRRLKRLERKGRRGQGLFKVVMVDPTSRNHQKIMARDWSLKDLATILISSANATQSGMKGDLVEFESLKRFHSQGKANANHASVVKSWPLANLVNHELTKTIDYRLRGTSGPYSYPLSGSYLVRRSDGSYFVLAFTPNGARGNIHAQLTARALRLTRGPVRILQFSASSPDVAKALLERAQQEMARTGTFDLKAISDLATFLADWSIFLEMASHRRLSKEEMQEQRAKFEYLPNGPWKQALRHQFERIMEEVRVAPASYGMFALKDPATGQTLKHPETGKVLRISAKLHHKAVIAGIARRQRHGGQPVYAIVDGSANATNSSLVNQEQIALIVDPFFSRKMISLFDGLHMLTTSELGVLHLINEQNRALEKKLHRKLGPPKTKPSVRRLKLKGHPAAVRCQQSVLDLAG